MSWKHFSDQEVEGLSPALVEKLDLARDICGFAFHITSGLRLPNHNADVGGVPDSAHLKGLAADLRRPVGEDECFKMVWALGLAGCRRIEIATKHIHVDVDDSKPAPVMWFGVSH